MPIAKTTTTTIELPRLNLQMLHIKLVGDSPLICHAWSHKAKKQMLDRQMKKAAQAKSAKDPEKDYHDSLYHLPDGGYGFPAVAFKASAVSACRFSDGLKMTEARGAFHISSEMVAIDGAPSPREDMVRVASQAADIRYRGEFKQWSAVLLVRLNANAMSPEQLVNLFNLAGFGVGIGEWRPERDGSYGMFHVASEQEAA